MGSVKTNIKKFLVMKEIKLSMFQYKIIHNILYANAVLCKMKNVEEPFCPFCPNEQWVSHLFVSCPIAVSFWSEFPQWYKSLSQKSLFVKKKLNMVFSFSALNHLILISKYLLYCKALNGIKIQFSDFLSLAQEKIEIEKYIATMNNKCSAFSWEIV